jgi:hypothetical protein
VTELSYTSGGSIQQAKVYLNDDYLFKTAPGFYSTGEVYLGDVVTHELGHLFGLSHSEILESTMFYSAFPGQNTLSPDDIAGIRGKYGPAGGSITGKVKGGNDIGILGVHVVAFSRTTGSAVSGISDQDGNFSIKGLDLNDTYYLYTTSLKNVSALPSMFANVHSDFCPANYVGGFFNACGRDNDGLPQPITLTGAVSSVNVGDVTINCSLKTNENYSVEKLQASFDPVTIFDYAAERRPEKAFVGYFVSRNSTAWSAYDKLALDLSGYTDAALGQKYLRLNLIARQFGNLLEYEMIVKRNGVQVGPTYAIDTSGITLDTDLSARADLSMDPSQNHFEIWIRSKKLSSVDALLTFPEVDQFVSNQYLPYLLTTGLEDGSGPLLDTTVILSDNSSCLDAPFAYATAPARGLASENDSSKTQQAQGPVSCGTTSGGGPQGPGSNGPLLMTFGFILAALLASARKTAKNFLS